MNNLLIFSSFFILITSFSINTGVQTPAIQEVKAITKKDILGKWESSLFLDKKQCKDLFGDEDGVEMEMTMKSTEEYVVGGYFNGNANATLRIYAEGQEVPLKMDFQMSGKWELHDSTIVIITEDTKVTALDEVTQTIFDATPELVKAFEPVKGESTQTKILSITNGIMQYKSEDTGDMVITATRK